MKIYLFLIDCWQNQKRSKKEKKMHWYNIMGSDGFGGFGEFRSAVCAQRDR